MRITLTVTAGPHAGREYSFDQHDNFIVGRSTSAQFRLPKDDQFFSRNHFLVEVNPPLCRLLDLQSRNGTFINGQRVTSVELRHGDLIRGGKTTLRVSIEESALTSDGASSPVLTGDQTVVPRDLAIKPSQTPKNVEMRQSSSGAAPPTLIPRSVVERQSAMPSSLQEPIDMSHVRSAAARTKPSDGFVEQFLGYRVQEEIGRGAMGIVYRAVEEVTNAPVAIKVITPAVAASRDDLARFVREAGILKELSHPHIVPFREMNHAAGKLFFVMDLIHGSDLDQLLKQEAQPLSVERAIRTAGQLLEALAFAHGRGYVHRDVKPSNLILETRSGGDHVWLADFGLARAYQSSRLSGLTMTDQIGGTTPFMPPEQITNFRNVDPAADQYAAAATLYFLLTQKHVYDFPRDITKQLLMILQEPPIPIAQRRADLPKALADAIHKALDREPKRRFADVSAFRRSLLQSLQS